MMMKKMACVMYLFMMAQCVIGGQQRRSDVSSVKELYSKHYMGFEKFVLDLKSQINSHSPDTIEWGARWWKWYNEFTIACIPISYPFFAHDKAYIRNILTLITGDKYLNCIEHSLERCKQKPGNLKLFDWIAQVSHEEHINNIDLPAGVQKNKLIANPKEYYKIIDKVSSQERDALIVVGLFSRYLAENNLL
jgi:hypothetical protein